MISGLLLLGGCKPPTQVTEKQLLFQGKSEQWWMFNAITQDKAENYAHLNVLINVYGSLGNRFASIFARYFSQENELAFQHQVPIKALSKSDQFPLLIESNSSETQFRLFLDRNNFWLSHSNDAAPDAQFDLDWKGKFRPTPYLNAIRIQENPAIWTTHSQKCTSKNLSQSKEAGFFSASGFEHSSDLVGKPGSAATVVWLDLFSETGGRIWLQLDLDEANQVKVKGCKLIDSKGGQASIQTMDHVTISNILHSTSGKENQKGFPTRFRIAFENSQDLEIRPYKEDQVFKLGRQTFWMGPIQAIGEDSQGFHRGNLYIFSY